MVDYLAQEAEINAFDPNKQTVAYAVFMSGHKDLTLCKSKGHAKGTISRNFPARQAILYENKNGVWSELDRTPYPTCSFCQEVIPWRYSGLDYRNILIKKTPQYKSALICDTCKGNNLDRDELAVDMIKYEKGF